MDDRTPNVLPTKLRNESLGVLSDAIKRPDYDRSKLTPGIVHIGLGNFHRAHQAWYLHRLMQQGLALDWAIIGAGVRPEDSMMRERLLDQDCLTTLIELDPDSTSAEIIGSMIDFLPVEEDNKSLVATMADPAIRIVSLTVTEGGYYQDANGNFDSNHPDIRYDAENPERSRTAFGAMVAALRLRRAAGHRPFTGQCCDNLQENGKILRQTVVGMAELIDPSLAEWIDQNATFPNAMVDCIVPATGPMELELAQSYGVLDHAVVTHENFRQWVIENKFCGGRPPWEEAGAILTDDVHPYESMKIRVLNAGHQVLANAGELLGLETIADCMADPDLLAFFRMVENQEILPTVVPVKNTSVQEYLRLIERRFSNPKIHDTTRRVAFDGSSRHPGFVLPIIRDAISNGSPFKGLAMVEAIWCKMCLWQREDGSLIEPNDPLWDQLSDAAVAAQQEPVTWLAQANLYGDISEHAEFADAFRTSYETVSTLGVRKAIKQFSNFAL